MCIRDRFEVGEQIVTLFAGNEGFLDDLEIADVLPFRAELIEYMDNGFGSLLDKVRAKKIDDDTKAELLRVIGDFKQQFMAKHLSLIHISYQSYDVLRAMEQDVGLSIERLSVDGGASRNEFIMQFQADLLEDVYKRQALGSIAGGAVVLIAAGVILRRRNR